MLLELWLKIGEWGVLTGSILIALPIVYDIVGIAYGRDLRLGIGFWGVVLQISGIVLVIVGRYSKKEWNK
jgi:hypothetical protein